MKHAIRIADLSAMLSAHESLRSVSEKEVKSFVCKTCTVSTRGLQSTCGACSVNGNDSRFVSTASHVNVLCHIAWFATEVKNRPKKG